MLRILENYPLSTIKPKVMDYIVKEVDNKTYVIFQLKKFCINSRYGIDVDYYRLYYITKAEIGQTLFTLSLITKELEAQLVKRFLLDNKHHPTLVEYDDLAEINENAIITDFSMDQVVASELLGFSLVLNAKENKFTISKVVEYYLKSEKEHVYYLATKVEPVGVIDHKDYDYHLVSALYQLKHLLVIL